MNELDRKLYSLLGDKTLSFGCKIINKESGNENVIIEVFTFSKSYVDVVRLMSGLMISEEEFHLNFEIIGHEPTIADIHNVFDSLKIGFAQYNGEILCTSFETGRKGFDRFDYDSSLSLLSQSEETKLAIVNLIESYER